MPNTAGTCVTFEIHFGRKPSRANSTSVVRPYSTQDSPCPCTSGSTITRPRWVTSLGSPSSSTGITDSALKAIGRPVGFLGDQRDDGARQTFALAGEDAVGEAAGRQRLAGDDAQMRHQCVEIVLRQRKARAFNDPRPQAGMGAQSEIDGGLRKRLPPEAGVARAGARPPTGAARPIAEMLLQKDAMLLARDPGRVVHGAS